MASIYSAIVCVAALTSPAIARAQFIPTDMIDCRGDHSRVGRGDFQVWCHVSEKNKDPTIHGILRRIAFNDSGSTFADRDLNIDLEPSLHFTRYLTNAKGVVNEGGLIEAETNFIPEGGHADFASAIKSFAIDRAFKPGMQVWLHGDWVEDSGHDSVVSPEDPTGGNQGPGWYTSGGKTEIHPLRWMFGERVEDGRRLSSFLVALDSSVTLLRNLRFPFQAITRPVSAWKSIGPVDIDSDEELIELPASGSSTSRAASLVTKEEMRDVWGGGNKQTQVRLLLPDYPKKQVQISIDRLVSPDISTGHRPFYIGVLSHDRREVISESISYRKRTCQQLGLSQTNWNKNKSALAIAIQLGLSTPESASITKSTWKVERRAAPNSTEMEVITSPPLMGKAVFNRYYAPACGRQSTEWKGGVRAESSATQNSASDLRPSINYLVAKDFTYSLPVTSLTLTRISDLVPFDVDVDSVLQMTGSCQNENGDVKANLKLAPLAVASTPYWAVRVTRNADGTEIQNAPWYRVAGSYANGSMSATVDPADPWLLHTTCNTSTDKCTKAGIEVSAVVSTDYGEEARASTRFEGKKCSSVSRDTSYFFAVAEAVAMALRKSGYWHDPTVLPNLEGVPAEINIPGNVLRFPREAYKITRNKTGIELAIAEDFVRLSAGLVVPRERLRLLARYLELGKRVKLIPPIQAQPHSVQGSMPE